MLKRKYNSTNILESLLAADAVWRCEIEMSRVRHQSLHSHVSCSHLITYRRLSMIHVT